VFILINITTDGLFVCDMVHSTSSLAG